MRILSFLKKAFGDMKASAKAQHEVDRAEFAAAKAEAKEEHDARIAAANARIEYANEHYDLIVHTGDILEGTGEYKNQFANWLAMTMVVVSHCRFFRA